jgi:hypothetical protein
MDMCWAELVVGHDPAPGGGLVRAQLILAKPEINLLGRRLEAV